MASHSPVRARKPQSQNMNGQPSRDLSPSPDPRDRQRTIKAQSLPIVPPLSQIYPNISQPNPRQSMQQTSSNPVRRGSPPISSNGSLPREDDEGALATSAPAATGPRPPPPPMHTASSSNIHDAVTSKPPVLPHSQSQPNVLPHAHPRPINRAVPPAFIDRNWELTAEFLAEIESADFQQAHGIVRASPSSGTAGLAYAGGISSGSNLPPSSRTDQGTPPRDATLDRTRPTNDHFAAVEQQASTNRRRERGRESPKPRVLTSYPQQPSSQQQQQGQARTPDRSSPQYTSPLNTPSEHPAPSYVQFKRVDNYPRVPSPLSGRRGSLSNTDPPRTTPPMGAHRNVAQTPPLYTQKTRGTPDKSLPVQEQEEGDDDRPHEDWNRRGQQDSRAFSSPVPSAGARSDGYDRDARQLRDSEPRPIREDDLPHSGRDVDDRPPQPRSGRNSRQAHREDDDDETLINAQTEDQDDDHQDDNANARDRSDGDDSGTPRSPTAELVEHRGGGGGGLYHHPAAAQSRAVLPLKHRNGALDRLGLQGFPDPTSFSMPPAFPRGRRPQPQTIPSAASTSAYDDSNHLPMGHRKEYPDDWQSYLDDPTTAYLQAYLQSPRPPAPTPGITTNPVPSPSPMVSATPSEAGGYAQAQRPVGSPYPFPFDHVRRQNIYSANSYAAPPSAPPPDSGTGSYDPNDPAAIEAQLALQAQMYALNNYAATSDVTLSPTGTPFPHAGGQNPWAFLQARMNLMGLGGGLGLGRQRLDSIRSSPSHEPLPLPRPPPIRGRGLKKRGGSGTGNTRDGGAGGVGNAANKKGGVQVPPRVDSTQPRDTSPEPSSGEETSVAGEHDDEVLDQVGVHDVPAGWTGAEDDWIDEDEDGDEEDFLELEYHPNYISNVDKRRRRWETKLEALTQAFHELDRQTDATLVLLASPSHSTRLHIMASRSIRRSTDLSRSASLAAIKGSFRQIAARRRAARSHRTTLVDRLSQISSSSGEGSDGSESREQDLKRALTAALGSLSTLSELYQQREARWREEMRQVAEEREKVDLVLRQALG